MKELQPISPTAIQYEYKDKASGLKKIRRKLQPVMAKSRAEVVVHDTMTKAADGYKEQFLIYDNHTLPWSTSKNRNRIIVFGYYQLQTKLFTS